MRSNTPPSGELKIINSVYTTLVLGLDRSVVLVNSTYCSDGKYSDKDDIQNNIFLHEIQLSIFLVSDPMGKNKYL